VVITNKEGIIEYVNPFFTKLTDYSIVEVIGKNPRVLQSGHHPRAFYKELWSTILSGKDWNGEILNKKKNGDLYWEKAIISPIVNSEGVVTNFVAIKEDITERKKMVEDLVAAKEKAEESDKLKTAFLANMSHEIRTPMNGILGFADLLKESELSGEQQQVYINFIEKSGERMLTIINNIISISKIESGIVDISLSEMNVNNQLEFVFNSMKLDAERKNLTLSYTTILTDKEAVVITDSEKFYGILTNLVKNAIKYTHEGNIEFGYYLKTDNEAVVLEFFIKDTGIGIPKDRQAAIFERFIQADIEDKMAQQGAGLGLAISKAYVEMLDGKIWVESEPNCGSIFYFTIPYRAKIKEKSVKRNPSSDYVNKVQPGIFKVLIVEDDEDSEEIIKKMLKNLFQEVLIAKNGLEAVDLCRQKPDIDLILMDMKMPEMNGYKATQQIRQFNKEIIIIAQTAFALSGDKEKAIEAGCNDYISKPIQKEKLIEIIYKHLNAR
jgi:PAS domain S-box-containing protein